MSMDDGSLFPSGVTGRIGFFDRFAGWASGDREPRSLLRVLSAPGRRLARRGPDPRGLGGASAFLCDPYQLQINTTTTIITFLLVALLQNSQMRSDRAIQHKLNAVADGLADLMGHLAERADDADLRRDIDELRAVVGLERRETTGHRAG